MQKLFTAVANRRTMQTIVPVEKESIKTKINDPNPLLRYEIRNNLHTDDSITIAELTDIYEEYLPGRGAAPKRTENLQAYAKYIVNKHTIQTINRIFFDLLDVPVNTINNINFRQWCDDYKQISGLAASSMNRNISSLRGMFTWAAKYGYISGPELRGLELFSGPVNKNIGTRRQFWY